MVRSESRDADDVFFSRVQTKLSWSESSAGAEKVQCSGEVSPREEMGSIQVMRPGFSL